jgi:hypothetical protein
MPVDLDVTEKTVSVLAGALAIGTVVYGAFKARLDRLVRSWFRPGRAVAEVEEVPALRCPTRPSRVAVWPVPMAEAGQEVSEHRS